MQPVELPLPPLGTATAAPVREDRRGLLSGGIKLYSDHLRRGFRRLQSASHIITPAHRIAGARTNKCLTYVRTAT